MPDLAVTETKSLLQCWGAEVLSKPSRPSALLLCLDQASPEPWIFFSYSLTFKCSENSSHIQSPQVLCSVPDKPGTAEQHSAFLTLFPQSVTKCLSSLAPVLYPGLEHFLCRHHFCHPISHESFCGWTSDANVGPGSLIPAYLGCGVHLDHILSPLLHFHFNVQLLLQSFNLPHHGVWVSLPKTRVWGCRSICTHNAIRCQQPSFPVAVHCFGDGELHRRRLGYKIGLV